MEREINTADYLGKRTLILGDVNTGKTTLTQRILDALCGQGLGPRIVVIDMAPEVPEAMIREKRLTGIGGRLQTPAGGDAVYLRDDLVPPRLSTKSEAEAEEKAIQNTRKLEVLFRRYHELKSDILVMNDISLYLQAGRAVRLIQWMQTAKTVVANGYFGEKLGSGILSRRERAEMESLLPFFDRVLRLQGSGI
ncbi:MAG TPA: hypothetical protein PLR20_07490 [Syntrophales bacterium]|nr:hypothetical protein [Syntrophales bacterium]HOX93302.1 hypothetical protein [Syntrophales bacterium]HPI56503.1 hypothetical protein [Syntrophales bacterium]HPN25076.1 hypothetical protein [Syntrophales bacterium]HQM29181.1 hypothetical protein [Syntrophales bacterium]